VAYLLCNGFGCLSCLRANDEGCAINSGIRVKAKKKDKVVSVIKMIIFGNEIVIRVG
jgi:hypothetical protein